MRGPNKFIEGPSPDSPGKGRTFHFTAWVDRSQKEPEREMTQVLIDATQKSVNGTVRLKLYKGNCMVVGRKSESSLYDPNFATFESDEVYNQKDAEGFIRLSGLRLKIARLLEQKRKAS